MSLNLGKTEYNLIETLLLLHLYLVGITFVDHGNVADGLDKRSSTLIGPSSENILISEGNVFIIHWACNYNQLGIKNDYTCSLSIIIRVHLKNYYVKHQQLFAASISYYLPCA